MQSPSSQAPGGRRPSWLPAQLLREGGRCGRARKAGFPHFLRAGGPWILGGSRCSRKRGAPYASHKLVQLNEAQTSGLHEGQWFFRETSSAGFQS